MGAFHLERSSKRLRFGTEKIYPMNGQEGAGGQIHDFCYKIVCVQSEVRETPKKSKWRGNKRGCFSPFAKIFYGRGET